MLSLYFVVLMTANIHTLVSYLSNDWQTSTLVAVGFSLLLVGSIFRHMLPSTEDTANTTSVGGYQRSTQSQGYVPRFTSMGSSGASQGHANIA